MKTQQHTCYSAECATPGCDPFEDAGGTPHFPSPELARSTLINDWGWTLIGGVLRCFHCSKARVCEQEGHKWRRRQLAEDRRAWEACTRCSATRDITEETR